MKVVELLQSLADIQVPSAPAAIPEALMQARLAQPEQLRGILLPLDVVPHAGHFIPPVPKKGFSAVTPSLACNSHRTKEAP